MISNELIQSNKRYWVFKFEEGIFIIIFYTLSECQGNYGVPQDSILAHILYMIYTIDNPTQFSTVLTTHADDTCALSVNYGPASASKTLQSYHSPWEMESKSGEIKLVLTNYFK